MEYNLNHIWLPYTQHQTASLPLAVADADGCKIKLENGKELIDGISSWWSVCHGYKHPHLVKSIQTQAEKLSHVMFAGLAHEGAYKLAERVAKLTNLPRVFFSDSGSTAVEIALKMATQYWRNQNKHTKKQRFLCFTHGYHGDTMGAMSVSDDSVMHSAYSGYMPMQFLVDIPSDELGFQDFDALLASQKTQIAAVIIEPLVQMAGGMKFHSPDILAEIYRITKKHDILFIADEIATGFGRTGYMFAHQEAGIEADIICLGKALSGGMMTFAATCAKAEVFEKFLSDKKENALMHGPTFMANPLGCAAANASLDLFENEPRLAQIEKIEALMLEHLAACRQLPAVKDVRVKGAIGVVQLNMEYCHSLAGGNLKTKIPDSASLLGDDKNLINLLRKKFLDNGALIRPFGDVIYLAPPFVISEDELKFLCDKIKELIGMI